MFSSVTIRHVQLKVSEKKLEFPKSDLMKMDTNHTKNKDQSIAPMVFNPRPSFQITGCRDGLPIHGFNHD